MVSLLLESAKGPDNVMETAKSSLDDVRKYSEKKIVVNKKKLLYVYSICTQIRVVYSLMLNLQTAKIVYK